MADPAMLPKWPNSSKKESGPEKQEQLTKIKSVDSDVIEKHIEAFKKGVLNSRVVTIPESNHFLFITKEDEVLRELRNFLESLP